MGSRKLDSTRQNLRDLTTWLEARGARSKWNWVTLAAGMVIAAALAGAGAFFAAKAQIEKNDFQRSVNLITQDDDAYWCDRANAPIIQDRNGLSYCAIAMPQYQTPEEPAESGN